MNAIFGVENDIGASHAHLIPEVDKAEERRKYRQSMKYFDFVALIAHFLGIAMIALHGYVFGTSSNGFHWGLRKGTTDPTGGYVNFHGFFMTTAFIFFQGEALLAYRIHRHEIKMLSKFIHGSFHLIALCCAGVGFTAIFDMRNAIHTKHFSTFHSWIGAGILTCYVLQWIAGFINFAFPKTPAKFRASFLPFHIKFGMVLLFVCVAQVLAGHIYYANHIQMAEGTCVGTISCANHIDLLHNFSCIAVVLYAAVVYVLVSRDSWKRAPTPDEYKHE